MRCALPVSSEWKSRVAIGCGCDAEPPPIPFCSEPDRAIQYAGRERTDCAPQARGNRRVPDNLKTARANLIPFGHGFSFDPLAPSGIRPSIGPVSRGAGNGRTDRRAAARTDASRPTERVRCSMARQSRYSVAAAHQSLHRHGARIRRARLHCQADLADRAGDTGPRRTPPPQGAQAIAVDPRRCGVSASHVLFYYVGIAAALAEPRKAVLVQRTTGVHRPPTHSRSSFRKGWNSTAGHGWPCMTLSGGGSGGKRFLKGSYASCNGTAPPPERWRPRRTLSAFSSLLALAIEPEPFSSHAYLPTKTMTASGTHQSRPFHAEPRNATAGVSSDHLIFPATFKYDQARQFSYPEPHGITKLNPRISNDCSNSSSYQPPSTDL